MRILFVSANPDWTPRLSLLDEIRELHQALKGKQVDVDLLPAAQPEDLMEAIEGKETIDVLHFAGHATERDGLMFRYPASPKGKKALDNEELAEIFAGKKVTLAVLNACNTEKVSAGLNGIADHIICTKKKLEDKTAKQLTKVLYERLSSGKSVAEAFDAAIDNISDLELQKDVYLKKSSPGDEPTVFEFEPGEVTVDPEQQEEFDRFFYERYLEMQIRSQEKRNLFHNWLSWGVFGIGVAVSVFLFTTYSNEVGSVLRFIPDTDSAGSEGRNNAYDEWLKFSGEHMLASITAFGNAIPGVLGALKGLLFTRGRDDLRSMKQLLEIVKSSADMSPDMRAKLYHIMEQNVLAAAAFAKPEKEDKKG